MPLAKHWERLSSDTFAVRATIGTCPPLSPKSGLEVTEPPRLLQEVLLEDVVITAEEEVMSSLEGDMTATDPRRIRDRDFSKNVLLGQRC
mmetsp:Transcript_11956/g.19311  ORF Transcript_11956/g.19311 Transcript_11956/m.19311 type:complete len:90 (-) Transcript_11956:23-292(-)|eukprot:CAMPEP_0184674038 /NCGR_PEP_ID=MMETSP0308-20130426/87016_1 /TAXON_ID=38269 /ORGANISM="Gloeochaete witrockiana, Strain SAG 46.84" /LENGTH=89 /DNA_ID=CAMNT_0027121601 /DNA_START=1892 /DNA_END=2161 /DNA_ORIENTATION=+